MKVPAGVDSKLKQVKDFFETYPHGKALQWYTKQTFLYPLINKALRVQNIELLFLYCFFKRDTWHQLVQTQCQWKKWITYIGRSANVFQSIRFSPLVSTEMWPNSISEDHKNLVVNMKHCPYCLKSKHIRTNVTMRNHLPISRIRRIWSSQTRSPVHAWFYFSSYRGAASGKSLLHCMHEIVQNS